ncbi:MAG: flagellar biosynthesis anti-sigma factor FlgM [Candidatus Auribacter fodinae]|jgi:anti-sigma28 factor (negative regulator of flagellin synthesis)|uniref:Flagellar biosynthesis anti-sigma factor FlgM n=1 Tax=Candidatus Auribacter fodinae TaxID=2093366 RepID=A0A3A4R9T0_9BACT|nr:MAG: flagellar biosynthesis anti-sigma factor FlgM [Candidatus Auribacter fodinae]
MEIKNINNITRQIRAGEIRNNPTQTSARSTKTAEDAQVSRHTDSLQISDQARTAQEIQKYTDIARKMPSVRPEVVNRVKERIQSGFYENNREVLEDTASSILNSL